MREWTRQISFFLVAIAACGPVFGAGKEEAIPPCGIRLVAVPATASPPVEIAPSPAPANASASSVPISTSVAIPSALQHGSTPSLHDNSVESFFQIGVAKADNSQGALMQPVRTVTTLHQVKCKSLPHALYRLVWHVMDNMGVPMFFGQDHCDVDHGIQTTYVIPSPKLPPERAIEKLTPVTTQQPDSTTAQSESHHIYESQLEGSINTHQIPESELEGVRLPTPLKDSNVTQP